jgi:hypothetical protein
MIPTDKDYSKVKEQYHLMQGKVWSAENQYSVLKANLEQENIKERLLKPEVDKQLKSYNAANKAWNDRLERE